MSITYVENRASYARLLAGDGTAITDTVAGRLDVQCAGAVTVTNDTANNFLCNANLQVGDADVDSSNKVPVEGTFNPAVVGVQANAWSAASVSADGNSSAVDCQYVKQISVFGQADGPSTLTVQVSQNNSNWYGTTHSIYAAASVDFYADVEVGARYVRLLSSAAATITATIAGKQ